MAWNKSKEISMIIEKNFDFIIEEGQNTSINLRKISWNDRPSKIDIRKWSYTDGQERAMKGISLTDEGTNELTGVLVEQGYGDTKRIINALKNRDDYDESLLNNTEDNSIEQDDEPQEYYDPSELLGDY